MDPSKANRYKLETEFRGDYIQQTPYSSSRRKTTVRSKWKTVKVLGSGAFGTVFLQEEEGGEKRAVKEQRGMGRDDQERRDFYREVLALAKLKGPEYRKYFVQFMGWYEDEQKCLYYLAMEYVEYGDLGQYIKEWGPEAKLNAPKITKQILRGLEILHEKNICHRDLKPQVRPYSGATGYYYYKIFGTDKVQNVLISSLSPKLCVKIADFGISKRVKGTVLRTHCGTPLYQAPELQGLLDSVIEEEEEEGDYTEPGEYTYAVDLWSLGCLVHEILTLRIPFYRYRNNQPTYVDARALGSYCEGRIVFPEEILRNSQVSEEGIVFVKGLLAAKPSSRLTATDALMSPWLVEKDEKINPEILRGELSSLGAELGAAAAGGYLAVVKLLLGINADINPGADLDPVALRAAAGGGHLDVVKLLLDNKADVNAPRYEEDGLAALQAAAGGGHLDVVKLLLDNNADVNPKGNTQGGQTPLQAAAEGGHLEIVKLLVQRKADTNARKGNQTALQRAAKGGHLEVAKFLLDNKADANVLESEEGGQTALQAAAGAGHLEIVKLLLERNAEVDAKGNEYSTTALHTAAEGGHLEVVRLLLDNKADINAEGHHNRTAVEEAAKGGHLDVVRLLLERNPTVNAADEGYALRFAAGSGYLEVVKLLLADGDSPNLTSYGTLLQVAAEYGRLQLDRIRDAKLLDEDGRKGFTALQSAAAGGYLGVVKLLLDNKANVNAASGIALRSAAAGGHLGVVKLLLDHKANVEFKGPVHGLTALQAAAAYGHLEIVKLLLENKADVNSNQEEGGPTALQGAALFGHLDIVELLLDNNADVDAEIPGEGITALYLAAGTGHLSIAKLLLDSGANVNASTCGSNSGLTALHISVAEGHLETVKLLLDSNADVNAKVTPGDFTALHAAAALGHLDIVKLLLNNNANANAEGSRNGITALQAAAASGNLEVVQLLLDKKANVNSEVPENGFTALQAAATCGHPGIVEMLLDNNANANAKGSEHVLTKLREAAKHGGKAIGGLLFGETQSTVDANNQRLGALEAATKFGNLEVVKLLTERSINTNAPNHAYPNAAS